MKSLAQAEPPCQPDAADGARRRIALDCLQPEFDDDGISVFNDELLAMPTKPGRRSRW